MYIHWLDFANSIIQIAEYYCKKSFFMRIYANFILLCTIWKRIKHYGCIFQPFRGLERYKHDQYAHSTTLLQNGCSNLQNCSILCACSSLHTTAETSLGCVNVQNVFKIMPPTYISAHCFGHKVFTKRKNIKITDEGAEAWFWTLSAQYYIALTHPRPLYFSG